ncbi:hypothetical protein GCM10009525_37500 [Streptosporangium amethystogenes subsp. fukuiense]
MSVSLRDFPLFTLLTGTQRARNGHGMTLNPNRISSSDLARSDQFNLSQRGLVVHLERE